MCLLHTAGQVTSKHHSVLKIFEYHPTHVQKKITKCDDGPLINAICIKFAKVLMRFLIGRINVYSSCHLVDVDENQGLF